MASNELQVLQRVKLNWNWTVSLDDIWTDPPFDVPDIQAGIRAEFAARLDALSETTDKTSPLGWVITGRGGTGKTHLLGRLRAECTRRHATFILVDMTDVRDFWDTVLLGYCSSLQQPGENGKSQIELLIAGLLSQFRSSHPAEEIISTLRNLSAEKLVLATGRVVAAAARQFPAQGLMHSDVIRALIALKSDDFAISNIAYTWLTGAEVEPEDRRRLGLTRPRESSSAIVRGLSWLTSLRGPTVIALDQLDPIVTQLKLERDVLSSTPATVIINKLGAGLMELRDLTRRTLTVVSCVELTWNAMRDFALHQARDRFESPRVLVPTKSEHQAEALLVNRMRPGFEAMKFTPPYPTWPFKADWLRQRTIDSPREILKACSEHIEECIRHNEVKELPPGWTIQPEAQVARPEASFEKLDEQLARLRAAADARSILQEANEDGRFADLIRVAVRCALEEARLPPSIDYKVDDNFAGAPASKPLHARLRLIFPDESSREEHVCLRALQKTHGNAFSARLRSAITLSGIDKQMPFRRLVILRSDVHPGGKVTTALIQQFADLGGVWLKPADDDLATLDALRQMEKENDPRFKDWLKIRRPASGTRLVREALVPLFKLPKGNEGEAVSPRDQPPMIIDTARSPLNQTHETHGSLFENPSINRKSESEGLGVAGYKPTIAARATKESVPVAPATTHADLLLGFRLIMDKPASLPTTMPISALKKHGVIFAGAGSGKTVLLKRLIEEAAMLGVPSIVIDCANDLASIGDPWPAPPPHWGANDASLAAKFTSSAECIIWTPGKGSGNPMTLEPLPDLSALISAPEEFDEAVAMAVDALSPVTGIKPTENKKKAILRNALSYLGRNGDCHLDGLGAILRDFPEEATTRISKEGKIAQTMADDLNANLTNDAMLRGTGVALDPKKLLSGSPGKTRISIVSLVGLQSIDEQRQFLNQLAMILFSWIKKNPAPPDAPLRGLLVIDEARDFVPSGRGSACLASMQRLAAQARKYGMGLIFATQNPKDIDNKIIGQCSTHWYGKMNSPAAMDAAGELLRARGAQSADDVGALKTGRFYVSNADHLATPTKLATPMCLSAHGGPLSPEAVVQKAATCRDRS